MSWISRHAVRYVTSLPSVHRSNKPLLYAYSRRGGLAETAGGNSRESFFNAYSPQRVLTNRSLRRYAEFVTK